MTKNNFLSRVNAEINNFFGNTNRIDFEQKPILSPVDIKIKEDNNEVQKEVLLISSTGNILSMLR